MILLHIYEPLIQIEIITLLVIIFVLIYNYSVKFKRRIKQSHDKLDNISKLINSVCLNKLDYIKSGYNFVNFFQKLYNQYKPCYIAINALNWCDKIGNFKLNNIIKIEEDGDPFEVIESLQDYPISDNCWLNEMLANRDKYRYIDFSQDLIYKPAVADIKCAYAFFKYQEKLPVFVCVISYTNIVKLSEDEMLKIYKEIENIKI